MKKTWSLLGVVVLLFAFALTFSVKSSTQESIELVDMLSVEEANADLCFYCNIQTPTCVTLNGVEIPGFLVVVDCGGGGGGIGTDPFN
ncbi:MAG: hypothetical protein AAF849_00825 [Bacteroidota bacterium]